MNILCSYTSEELTVEECLACARQHINPPCGFDESLLKALYSNAVREGIHVTDLTGCLKMSYLKRVTPVPEHLGG